MQSFTIAGGQRLHCYEIGDLLALKFSTGISGGTETVPENVTHEFDEKSLDEQKRYKVEPPRWTLGEVLATGVRDARMQLRQGRM